VHFQHQTLVQRNGVQAQFEEGLVGDVQFILVVLEAGVFQIIDRHAGHLRDHVGQLAHAMRFSHLVQDLNPLAMFGWMLDRQLHAADSVLDVDERASLPARSMHRQRMADRRLHQEAVQHGPIVTVVVEAVDQALVHAGFDSICTPYDALVKVGDAHAIVLVVIGEEQLVLRLGQVIDTAGVRRVEDVMLGDIPLVVPDLNLEVTFGNLHTGRTVAIDAHRAEVHHVDVQAGIYDGAQDIVRRIEVVVHGVALLSLRLHGIRRCALLSEMNDRVRLEVIEKMKQPVILLRNVEILELDHLVGQFLPHLDAGSHWSNRRQRIGLQFIVDVPS